MSVVDRLAGALGGRTSRRGFLVKAALAGTATAAAPATYVLRPVSAHAAICTCAGQPCACTSMCCAGFTEFCCTMTGRNMCPPGSLTGGWWRVDNTPLCSGPRYYLDCHNPCSPACGCTPGLATCSGSCSGTTCSCANGSCGNRKAGCSRFRYGQCNRDQACLGPIVCRIVTCIPPWQIDPACSTRPLWDEDTRYHDAACLHVPFGAVDEVAEGPDGLRLAGWVVDGDVADPTAVEVRLDGALVAVAVADRYRPDVAALATLRGHGPFHGFDVTVPVAAGTYQLELWARSVGRVGGPARLLQRTVAVGVPSGELYGAAARLDGLEVTGWAADPTRPALALDVRVLVDGVEAAVVRADRADPALAERRPDLGAAHGFRAVAPAAPGAHEVCAELLLPDGSAPRSRPLGCTTGVAGPPDLGPVTPDPGGRAERVRRGAP